ncbi:MAG: AAA family ATPase [Candidatus Pacebacteria bacterium]|nr:AAA family ATPase [Candidatus Paceibacterota bacterium]MBT4652371.1 AAA family ATPase [Candidatus Paceibacterota bacterium]MBT6756198.1 AAA family ATPase [Candidatus Paceibacterota bacterium]MBT6921489.1 AAA family ATPase [Candidatus Paceibacterota bacterium]
MKIVLVGIQGAGKSTQGNLLSEKFGVPYLSSGHIFRQMSKSKTKLGRWLKETLNSGALVPDETAVEIVMEYLKRPEYAKGYVMDGFPRTEAQAKVLDGSVDTVFLIDVSDKEALWRISGRMTDRQDETLQAIRKRIELFHDVTSEVLNFYEKEGKLIKVDGELEVEKVFEQIVKAVQKREKKA